MNYKFLKKVIFQDPIILVDREEGGRENIEQEGYWLKAIFTKSELVEQ